MESEVYWLFSNLMETEAPQAVLFAGNRVGIPRIVVNTYYLAVME